MSWFTFIPRPGSGTTILGGCKQKGNWDAEVDEELDQRILERIKRFGLAEELRGKDGKGDFDVISSQVGLRPGRKGGPRVEIDGMERLMVFGLFILMGTQERDIRIVWGLLKRLLGLWKSLLEFDSQFKLTNEAKYWCSGRVSRFDDYSGSPKRLPRIPSRTSIKIDYITPWVTTHGNSGISFKERSLLAILFSIAYLISTSQTPETNWIKLLSVQVSHINDPKLQRFRQ